MLSIRSKSKKILKITLDKLEKIMQCINLKEAMSILKYKNPKT